MKISKIFINKKTGNLIIVYHDYYYNTIEDAWIYNQLRNEKTSLYITSNQTFVSFTNYIKAQLNKNWIQTSNLITLNCQSEKRRLFSFRNRYYRQILNKSVTRVHFQEIKGRHMETKDIFNIEIKDMLNINKESKNAIFKKVQTAKYIYDLLPILEDL